jgi:hypothetical protein
MPLGSIERMMEWLSTALARYRLEGARSLMAPICEFYLIQRPTLVATLTWRQEDVSRRTLVVRIAALAVGRKNKDGRTLVLRPAVPDGHPARHHPITFLAAYLALWFRFRSRTSSAGLGLDLPLFAAAYERQRTTSSVEMNKWLADAYHLCALPQPAGLTAKSCRTQAPTICSSAAARTGNLEVPRSKTRTSTRPCGSTWLLLPTYWDLRVAPRLA